MRGSVREGHNVSFLSQHTHTPFRGATQNLHCRRREAEHRSLRLLDVGRRRRERRELDRGEERSEGRRDEGEPESASGI